MVAYQQQVVVLKGVFEEKLTYQPIFLLFFEPIVAISKIVEQLNYAKYLVELKIK